MDQHSPTALSNTLSKLGLEKYHPNKLTLRSLLLINKDSMYDNPASSPKDIPRYFLTKLLQINADCRGCTELPDDEEEHCDPFGLKPSTAEANENKVNYLDLIVALFLCADSFLQQRMALRMSMCQFSFPLLLPHYNNSQSGLMLWTLRDIVKEWSTPEMSESKSFAEDSVAEINAPFFSFVRLKNSSLSKSQLLNHILSHGQQNKDIFMHRDMEGGAHQREIANGLVEISWFLPSGRENQDVFQKPIIFANLRGDVSESPTEFSFLCQVSTAIFVLMDKIQEDEEKILNSLHDVKSKLFFVFNQNKNPIEDAMSVKTMVETLHIPKNQVITKDQKTNIAGFSKKLCATINKSQAHLTSCMSIVNMRDKAMELGLSVDEHRSDTQKKAADRIMEGIGVKTISDYKKQELCLQGENWKKISKIEKEECRLNKADDSTLEDYKAELQKEKEALRKEQSKYKPSNEMKMFIESLSVNDKEKRDFFFKWMKLELDSYTRINFSQLRNKLQIEHEKENVKAVAELGQTLLDSSLGIEHYMREMGLIYEFSHETTEEITHLPRLAAEMVLDGHPLELLDGDASNIPEKWVSAVLNEVHMLVGGRSRLLVLTVLGVQSSGKSTLLNTMFGVQFPVSSGRCTRGAYMILLPVGEDLKSELNYDFVVLIDTEGLKSPQMAQLEDSYEHDNQLATFVIGLSDITIINIAMENATEMKDILQIVVHAFIRMKEIGKKPVCHFVHQNVAEISAHSKSMTDRKCLLDQLNEMTKIAAEMEMQSSFKLFTDVLDYDINKNNWYIPGLWLGTSPMASVSTGYSEAAAELKTNLLMTKKENMTSQNEAFIPEFLQWMKSLWKAVKYENFIFSFRNTLVANAYDNLWKEFNKWEWEFRKQILTGRTEAEMEICNANSESEQDLFNLTDSKKEELSKNIQDQETEMRKKLLDYYERKDVKADLIEKYKTDFLHNITNLANEIQNSLNRKLDCVYDLQKRGRKVQDIHRKCKRLIEQEVENLLKEFRGNQLSEKKLTDEFEKMWSKATENMAELELQDISGQIKRLLRESFGNRNISEGVQKINDLKETEDCHFKVKSNYLNMGKRLKVLILKNPAKRDLQAAVDALTESCRQKITGITKSKTDYSEFFAKDLLDTINSTMTQKCKHYNTTFEVDLKVHICGFALKKFNAMHKTYLHVNSPLNQLDKYKKQYLSDFIDHYKQSKNKTEQSQKKASDFVKFCLKPAVEDFINRYLGTDIVDEILKYCASEEYSSSSVFKYNIQKQLLQEDNFEGFEKYISNFELYIKNWIFQHILQKMSEDETLIKLKKKNLEIIVNKITEAIKLASKAKEGALLSKTTENIAEFFSRMQKYLVKDISFSVEAEKTTLFPVNIKTLEFADSLLTFVKELRKQFQEEFSRSDDVADTISKLSVKPQDELFRKVFGCGRQCPFCKVPCDAGGKQHLQHQAAVHRPKGLGGYRYETSGKLVETLCTTSVNSEQRFRNTDTDWKYHPNKKYMKIYPNWKIPPDSTIEASDYWKYVLVKYNDRFAKMYKAKPADIPVAWKNITKEQALKGLKDAFNMRENNTELTD